MASTSWRPSAILGKKQKKGYSDRSSGERGTTDQGCADRWGADRKGKEQERERDLETGIKRKRGGRDRKRTK